MAMSNAQLIRKYVKDIERDNRALREALFDLLDYMEGSDLEGLKSGDGHPFAKAWALRKKLEGDHRG